MTDDLVTVLARAFKKHRIDSEIRALQDEVDGREPYDGFTDEEFAQAAIDAITSAGYVVVPVEMTDAMERAQRLEFARYITDEKADIKAASRSAHKAMLAAALAGRKDEPT